MAIVDHRPHGGTSALSGCDPRKMLIAATEVIDCFERMSGIDTVTGELSIDWAALQPHECSLSGPVREKPEQA